MIRYLLNRPKTGINGERGVVLIAILLFIGMILPVTLLILDTVRIESLLPVNEAYTRTAGDEAEKGFYEAMAAIMADQDSFVVDFTRDVPAPGDTNQQYWHDLDPDSVSGKHEIDYLAEYWARHPENDTVFLVERSLENWDDPVENPDAGADPDEFAIPTRWQLMNVPFGMDDFGEYYDDGGDNPRILLPFEYVGEDTVDKNAPAFYLDPSELSMLEVMDSGEPEGNPVAAYSFSEIFDYWQVSPANPNYYENITTMDPVRMFIPRPASYFRNAASGASVSINDSGLPADEGSFTPGFMRANPSDIDLFVYDGMYDFNFNPTNQYPSFLPLQQAVSESLWANGYFGSTGLSTTFNPANLLITSNLEYKPAPGSITRYQLGAQEGDAAPGWHSAIVSDEAGRFPINTLLNVVYSSHNLWYDDPELPEVRRDQFDADPRVIAGDLDHPNHSGYLLARDMIISLLITDQDMARLANNWDLNLYQQYRDKAGALLDQMLWKRMQLDLSSDFNRNGDYSDDESVGEIFQFPEFLGNNDSPTLDTPPGIDPLDGSGRIGDGTDLWDGSWRVYTNPKDMLMEFVTPTGPRLTQQDFDTLNQRVTMYTMDTEHTADPDHKTTNDGYPLRDVRLNINKMLPDDDFNTPQRENALWDILLPIIGFQRLKSIIDWRDGLLDLNGDGDLNDEYIEQPVSDERYDPTTNSYVAAEDWPVTTITYRERNHPDFQDPLQPDNLIDPDYLNIRSIGDLITIPMTTSQGVIAFSESDDANDSFDLVVKTDSGGDPGGVPSRLGPDRYYPDFTNMAGELAYNENNDVRRNNINLTNETNLIDSREHPSWGPGDSTIAYYDGDDLRIYNVLTSTDSLVLANADLPPDTDDGIAVPFFGLFGADQMIGQSEFQLASPDISPNSGNNEIAFTRVDESSTGDDFLDLGVAYNIASVKTDGSLLQYLTENDLGNYDYAPDFSSNGQLIAYTKTTYDWFFAFGFDSLVSDPFPITSLWFMDNLGAIQIPINNFFNFTVESFGDTPGFIHLDDIVRPGYVRVTMHQPMYPSWSPDDQNLVFMDLVVVFDIEANPFNGPDPIEPISSNANIYKIPFGIFQDWSTVTPIGGGIPNSTRYEIFPDWGQGPTVLAQQNDSQFGSVPGFPVPLPNASTAVNDPFTVNDRELIAMDIGEASLALRRSIGFGADDQNWRLKDLPAVPEHVVNVLTEVSDIICFRSPIVTYDPRYAVPNPMPFPPPAILEPPLQAYSGRININTTTRPVLRTVFLNMFQGPENDPDDDGEPNSPAPRLRTGLNNYPLNLLDPNLVDQDRFYALMIADQYAHQVCEYRKWIYNNQGYIGVTDETVPSNLPLYEQEYINAGLNVTHYGNYRANPYYPLVDTDGDTIAPDIPRYSPEPPFRSIADLFHVMTYDDREFGESWTYEGIGGGGGPEDTYIPRAIDPSSGNPVGSVDTYEAWGPIYNTDAERILTHGGAPGDLGGGNLYGFTTRVMNDFASPAYNDFYEHQRFRLFSADDFRRIAPFLTTRSYNYRIESRGTIRISSGMQRTDVNRDKIWIITTNTEANFGARVSPTTDLTVLFDSSFVAQNRGTEEYYILYFEETPQSGLEITRSNFLP